MLKGTEMAENTIEIIVILFAFRFNITGKSKGCYSKEMNKAVCQDK